MNRPRAKKSGTATHGESGRTDQSPAVQARRASLLAAGLAVLVVVAGLAVYANSFDGVLMFDDRHHVIKSETIRHLWPIGDHVVGRRRPVVNLSLAINYACGGLNVWGYHAVNLAVHLLAALTLFGVVRRTLLSERMTEGCHRAAVWLAFATALIWVVHPLNTQSVTYIIQRGESMMGLFYLLTLYCMIRGAGSARRAARGGWFAAAVAACALSMGSKAVAVTAPVVVLLYDRVFLANTWAELFRRRWGLYVGLAAAWILLGTSGVAGAVLASEANSAATVGFRYKGVSPWEYARTQPGVVLHYLRLCFWPRPLCLDYGWPIARGIAAIVLPALLMLALAAGTCWALVRRSWLGFAGVWFFLILLPTSSFIPIKDLAFEHRMYLPLAAVIAVVVGVPCAIVSRLGWTSAPALRWGAVIGGVLLVAVTVPLAVATVHRNRDYHNEEAMWGEVVAVSPHNARAHYNLGTVLYQAGQADEAFEEYERTLEIKPEYFEAHNNLGKVLYERRQYAEAAVHFREALLGDPNVSAIQLNMGNALAQLGKLPEAVEHYREALRLRPDFALAHRNLANALTRQGEFVQAAEEYGEAVRFDPDDVEVRCELGTALDGLGKTAEAAEQFRKATELDPKKAQAHSKLGLALKKLGDVSGAIESYRAALVCKADYPEAHNNLANALISQGDVAEAIAHYREAIRLRPRYAKAHHNLGLALKQQGDLAAAIESYRLAVQYKRDFPEAQVDLGDALMLIGKPSEAVTAYLEVLRVNPGDAHAAYKLGQALERVGRTEEAVATYREVLRLKPGHSGARGRLDALTSE